MVEDFGAELRLFTAGAAEKTVIDNEYIFPLFIGQNFDIVIDDIRCKKEVKRSQFVFAEFKNL